MLACRAQTAGQSEHDITLSGYKQQPKPLEVELKLCKCNHKENWNAVEIFATDWKISWGILDGVANCPPAYVRI
jgi:hypothetical protein